MSNRKGRGVQITEACLSRKKALMPLVCSSITVCAFSQNELELATFQSSTVKREKDIVVDSKIPVDGSDAALGRPAAVFKDLPSSSNILESSVHLPARGKQRLKSKQEMI